MGSVHHLPRTPLDASGPGDEPVALLTLSGVVARADMPALCARVHQLIDASRAALVVCDVAELTDPDCGTVDVLARMQLTARRLGAELRLRGATDELHEVLALAGLCDVVGLCAGYESS